MPLAALRPPDQTLTMERLPPRRKTLQGPIVSVEPAALVGAWSGVTDIPMETQA
jgi:hypothetical protein